MFKAQITHKFLSVGRHSTNLNQTLFRERNIRLQYRAEISRAANESEPLWICSLHPGQLPKGLCRGPPLGSRGPPLGSLHPGHRSMTRPPQNNQDSSTAILEEWGTSCLVLVHKMLAKEVISRVRWFILITRNKILHDWFFFRRNQAWILNYLSY